MKLSLALAFGSAMLCLSSARAASRPVAGVAQKIHGRPKIKAADKPGYKRIKLDQFIHEGDRLKTGKGDGVAAAFVGALAGAAVNVCAAFELLSLPCASAACRSHAFAVSNP